MKIVLLGDSITQGLGSKKVNFLHELLSDLPKGDMVINMALTGTTVDYVESIYDEILKQSPDYAIILYGNVDAMLKPNRQGKLFKYLPTKFKLNNGSMLLPRPFYSRSWHKNLLQHMENFIRTLLRKLVCLMDGYEQWMPIEKYKNHYKNVCEWLVLHNVKPIVCSTVFIDKKLFPGSQTEYEKFNLWMKSFARENNYPYIDFYHIFKNLVGANGWEMFYNHDHFHPNGNGYRVMAKEIVNTLQK